METRKGAIKKGLSEAEIEELRSQLLAKEAQLREQSEMLRQQRDDFEREKQASEKDLEVIRHNLISKEFEINKRLDSEKEREPEIEKTGINGQILQEIERMRQEMATFRGDATISSQSIPNITTRFPNMQQSFPPFPHGAPNDTPRVSFREALETIPIFDGRNIPLSQFTRACRRAKEIFPPSSEKNLTRLLLTKLRGRAICAVKDEECETITQLSDLLNGAFGSPKTIDQYRGELSTIFLKPNEHILDYISHVKDLRSSITVAERRARGVLSNDISREIEALTARSFCDELPLNYRLQLSKEHYSNPFLAFSHVKVLAERLELDNDRLESTRRAEKTYDRNTYAHEKPQARSTPIKINAERETSNRWTHPGHVRYHERPHYDGNQA